MVSNRRGQRPDPPWDLVIVVDGAPPIPGWQTLVADDATVIAADGGARYALDVGVEVSDLVGDLDTLTEPEVEHLSRHGTDVHRFDPDKDFTDFELAARFAATRRTPSGVSNGNRLLVVGGGGGRLDHALGNIVVLAGSDLEGFAVTALVDDAAIQPASPERVVTAYGGSGDLISLLPMFGDARGVSTSGLSYHLDTATLGVAAARGISNTISHSPATVTVGAGTVIVVEPHGAARVLANHSRGGRS